MLQKTNRRKPLISKQQYWSTLIQINREKELKLVNQQS